MAAVTDAGCLPPVIRKLRSNVGDLALAAAGCLRAICDLTARGHHNRAPERTEFVAALKAADGVLALIELLAKAHDSSFHDFQRAKPEPLEFLSVALLLSSLGKDDAEVRAQMVERGAIAAMIRLIPRPQAFEDRSFQAKNDAWGAASALSCLLDSECTADADSFVAPIVDNGGIDALLSLAKYGTLFEAQNAVHALRQLMKMGHVESPSPWPKSSCGYDVFNPWMDPARRAIMYRDCRSDVVNHCVRHLECAICMVREKTVVLGCGHRTCEVCARQLERCHVCRVPVTQRIRVYD